MSSETGNEESRVKIIHNFIMMNWWMVNLLGKPCHSLISIRDTMLMFFKPAGYEEEKMLKMDKCNEGGVGHDIK